MPTIDLFNYLGGDSTVYFWHATEYLPIPARIGGYATTHEYLAAYDDSTWAIDINEILWNANPPSPYYADFTIAYPSLAAVGPQVSDVSGGAVRLALLGKRPSRTKAPIAVDLPTAMQASLVVMDVQGRRVRVLLHGTLPAGRTTVLWDGTGENGARLGSGVYFVRLACSGQSRVARLVLLR